MIIPIVYSTNNGYIKHLCVSLTSFQHYSDKQQQYHILVLGDELTEKSKELIKQHITQKNISLHFIDIEKKLKENFSAVSYFTIVTLFRILVPELLQQYKKILYIDVDTIVEDPLVELWNLDISPYPLAAFAEPKLITQNKLASLNIPLNYSYLCSGVLVMDLEQLRKQNYVSNALDYYQRNKDNLPYPDQDLLNTTLHNQYKSIPFKYNHMTHYLRYYFEREGRGDEYSERPRIIHYVGKYKPDHYLYVGKFKQKYLHYLKMTSWKGENNIGKSLKSFFPKQGVLIKHYFSLIKTRILIFCNLYRIRSDEKI